MEKEPKMMNMIKAIFVMLLLILVMPSVLEQSVVIAQEKGRGISIGEEYKIRSKELEEERIYQVYLPESYNNKFYAPKKYPVVYLLDGNAHFQSLSGVIRTMGRNMQIPEMIVIAILNVDRIRDFTPTYYEKEETSKSQERFPTSGGADKFLKFLEKELMPEIEGKYRTMPYRVLVGHSMGGVLAGHVLLSEPRMFQGIIAVDPSLWWDNQILVSRGKVVLKEAKELKNRVFISLANHPIILDDPKAWEEGVKTFATLLETSGNNGSGIQSKLQYFEGEDHNSVVLVSWYYGLLFIFEGYKPPLTLLKEPRGVIEHFKKVSERIGIEIIPPEEFVNTMGIILLNKIEKVDMAIEAFKINVSNYAESFNVYDSLAEAYMVKGDKELAIKNYEKSLELNPKNENAKEQLKKIKEGANK